jgi:putative ABC transport system permease protein
MPELSPIFSQLPRVGSALALVAGAVLISRWQAVGLETQILWATGRAFVQLTAIGYALDLIFAIDQPVFILLVIAVMVTIAGFTAGRRGQGVPHSRWVALSSIALGTFLTLGLLIGLRVFDLTATQTIPIAGMVVGNAMNVCSLVMGRLHDDIRTGHDQIETALALGATSRQAAIQNLRRALQSGMTPIIDSTKTVGLIQLPGAMTGMILAGTSALEAVQIQIIVMYMLIGAAAFSGIAATLLTYRQFFTGRHQLLLPGGFGD